MSKSIVVKGTKDDPDGKRPRSFPYCPLTLRGDRVYNVPRDISEKNAALLVENGDAEPIPEGQIEAFWKAKAERARATHATPPIVQARGASGVLTKDTKIKVHAGEESKIEPASKGQDAAK